MLNPKIQNLQDLLVNLEKNPSLELGQDVVRAIVGLLVPGSEHLNFRQFTDQGGKLTANASWFQNDSVITDRLATYILDVPPESNLDIKLYAVKDASMRTIAWSVGLTENFEDEPFNGKFNVGIDFVIPKSLDRVIVALSKNYIVRTIELKGNLTATFQEILNSWLQISDLSRKAEFHTILWNSFDLHPINKRFYEGINQRFIHLCQHLENNSIHDSHHAAQFANRLIGRVIFTWFLDKKGFLNEASRYFQSMDFEDDTTYYKERLEPLFFEVLNMPVADRRVEDLFTPYLNGGLFESKPEDLYKSDRLTFPKNYFDDLLQFLRGYNFTTDESTSEFQQVAIDPEMLGRIFENLLAEVSEETGEQARKAKGAFYTPREVVDFMCREALKQFLRSQITADDHLEGRLYQLIDAPEREFHDQDHNWKRDFKPYKNNILDALDGLRIIDPACGSGAFPIGMLQLLVRVYGRLESRFDPYATKLSVIEKNIFGVDIEPMAVEISRLRAWLALVVDDVSNRETVKPLPNLDFKFVCANSLLRLDTSTQVSIFDDSHLDSKLQKIRERYFDTQSHVYKAELRMQYAELVRNDLNNSGETRKSQQLKTFRPFEADSSAEFFDSLEMFGVVDFDIVIGNPPYLSPKGIDSKVKARLEEDYGFVDDLYSHFYFRSLELLSNRGTLAFISSKTFWTIQSKLNLRQLLLGKKLNLLVDSSNPFESAMVDTCILMASSWNDGRGTKFYSSDSNYSHSRAISFSQELYANASNQVFFPPTPASLELYNRFNTRVKDLLDAWWPAIKTSGTKLQNKVAISNYVSSLKPGDIALLGTVVDGGQGMATSNNGRFLAVIEGTRQAERTRIERIQRVKDLMIQKKFDLLGQNETEIVKNLNNLDEQGFFDLVEGLKESYGRDALGKGYVYRIAPKSQLAEVSTLSDSEKSSGINGTRTFVPYDKGDRDGNTWVFPTPFVIEWSVDRVAELKKSSGTKGKGSARFQNPQFYFRAGVCWILLLNESSEYLKARLREPGVFDVNAMSIFVENEVVTEKFLVALLNSFLVFKYQKTFINSTSAFQINDAKQLPIVIPTPSQLKEFERLFDLAAQVKSEQLAGSLDAKAAGVKLQGIQQQVDLAVLNLYGVEENPEFLPAYMSSPKS